MTGSNGLIDRTLRWGAWAGLAVATIAHFIASGAPVIAGGAVSATIVLSGAYATRRANRGESGLSGRFFEQRKQLARDLAESLERDRSQDS